MGQQQILLIVLSLIVVGVAVAIAGNIFDSDAEEQNKDNIAFELVTLATIAQQYYHKPSQMGGGGNSFVGWQIPSLLDSTSNGLFKITSANNSSLTLTGTPFKKYLYNWYVVAEISNENIITEIIY